MLSLLKEQPYDVAGWKFLEGEETQLKHGDVVCYGPPSPEDVDDSSIHDELGFYALESGFASHTLGWTMLYLHNKFDDLDEKDGMIVSFWRKIKEKKPYEPSHLAQPLPLP